jgi:hypothetical protein
MYRVRQGGVVGGSPFLILFLFVPGFFAAFWDSLLFAGNTVLSIPVPWPWTVDFGALSNGAAVRWVLVGLSFIALILFGAAGLFSLFCFGRKNRNISAALVASVLMIIPYAHHAFSRADSSHLAQGIFPLLLAVLIGLALLPARVRWPVLLSLFVISWVVMLPAHPGWGGRRSSAWSELNVGGDLLQVPVSVASELDMLEELIQAYAPQTGSFIAVPYWPGAYAVARRKAPLYDVFPLFERSVEFQREEIDRIRLADPSFAVVLDSPLDGLEQRRFRNTNPLIDEYIRTHFERVDGFDKPRDCQVYRAR